MTPPAGGTPSSRRTRAQTPSASRTWTTTGFPAARAYLDLGLYISVAGVVTFKTAEPIREAVRIVPRDRLLVETDCPFLAPIPHRGKRNEPAWVVETARNVAQQWGATLDEVAAATTANARRLFRL